MSDDFLYSQLFSNPPPPKLEKKESNPDILNSLFEIDLPAPKKKEPEIKKTRNEDEINQYISSGSKNKTSYAPTKPKEQYSTKMQPVVNRPTSTSNPLKASTPKPVQRAPEKKEAKYMPNVVDIFAKKQGKPSKTKQVVQKSESTKTKPVQQKSKVEAKKEKIQRKEAEKINDKPKDIKAAPRPETAQKPKKEALKEKPIQKERPQKKKKQSSSESSSSSSSSEEESGSGDWRKHLRKFTGYNPADKKFKERDRMIIKQSGVDRIFGEDKFSLRMGRREEEQDLRLQQLRRIKKLKQKQHRH